MNAKEFIQDIKNNTYDFSITKDEKTTTEKIVLSYQKEYVDSIRKYMDQYIK
jgi:predicted hotdog family 3-hydroxylacyl-ACP dehydratase